MKRFSTWTFFLATFTALSASPLVAQTPVPLVPQTNSALGRAVGRGPAVFNYWGGLGRDLRSLREVDEAARKEGKSIPWGESREYRSLWIRPENGPSRFYKLAPPASREPAFSAPSADYDPAYRPPHGCCESAPICVDRLGWSDGPCTPGSDFPGTFGGESLGGEMPRP